MIKIKSCILFSTMLLVAFEFYGQVGIGTTNPSPASMLEVSSTSDGGSTYRGLMPPRVPNVDARDAINPSAEDTGLLVFVESTLCLQMWNGTDWSDVKCMDAAPPSGSVLLGLQDFETTSPTPLLPFSIVFGGGYTTGNGNTPNTPLYVSSARGYGVNGGTSIMNFGSIDASNYSSATLKLRLGGFSNDASEGLDHGDYVTISVSTGGTGGTFVNQLRVRGGATGGDANNTWGFDATKTVSAAHGASMTEFISGSGNNDGISYIELTGLPNSSNLAVQIQMINDNSAEQWVIDDVEIYGEP